MFDTRQFEEDIRRVQRIIEALRGDVPAFSNVPVSAPAVSVPAVSKAPADGEVTAAGRPSPRLQRPSPNYDSLGELGCTSIDVDGPTRGRGDSEQPRWLAVNISVATTTFVIGSVILVWSIAPAYTQLWKLGLPLVLGGVMLLLSSTAWRLWRIGSAEAVLERHMGPPKIGSTRPWTQPAESAPACSGRPDLLDNA